MQKGSPKSKRSLLTRRDWLKAGSALGLTGAVSAWPLVNGVHSAGTAAVSDQDGGHEHLGPPTGAMHTMGKVDHVRNGFDPLEMLTDFDYGSTSVMADGRTLREYDFIAQDREIEIAPGILYPGIISFTRGILYP